MAEPFHWTCPYCNRNATIKDDNMSSGEANLNIKGSQGCKRAYVHFIVCPNSECQKFTLSISLLNTAFNEYSGKYQVTTHATTRHWKLIPESRAQSFPNYIPEIILNDYNEACLIVDKSPKASATLSRRCIQGILRDYWGVSPGRLVDEIEQVKDKIDSLTWEAIDAVRKVGNIGAHMEKDINLIVDVDPQEAVLLVELIETLLRDWYVTREEKRVRLLAIKKVAEAKKAEQSGS